MEEENEDIRRVRLGNEARGFYSSQLGKYLVTKADDMIEAKTVELILADPTDVSANTRIRSELEVGALFKRWLDEAIVDGVNTELQMQQEEVLSGDNAVY